MRLRLLAAALLLLAHPAAARPPSKAVALAPCQLGGPDSAVRVAARCGTLEVPEDHARPEGRKLRLRLAVVDAERTEAAPDPLVLLAGGPGQAALEAYPPLLSAFRRVGRDRDLVLVDQRGTGGSGRLTCPELDDPGALDRTEPLELELIAACAAALSAGADLTRYGTEAFARDLDLVRAALGYQRLNLFGASYGTRAAQVYARLFPARVRTLVLDGVAPMAMAIGEAFGEDADRALDLALARCQADATCRGGSPPPRAELEALLAALERRPARLTVRDPLSGAPVSLVLRAETLRGIVFRALYSPETTALLPALLQEARAGDLGPLAALGLLGIRDVTGGVNRPLLLSVVCAEDVPFYGAAPVRAGLLGTGLAEGFQKACARWPRAPVDRAFHEPLRSEVPALLLSGQGDPVTPPRWAERAAAGLPSARHLVLAGAAHGTAYRGCLPRLLAQFLASGNARDLDASCLERIRPPPFFPDLAGPPP